MIFAFDPVWEAVLLVAGDKSDDGGPGAARRSRWLTPALPSTRQC
jgi:hypothetical protein